MTKSTEELQFAEEKSARLSNPKATTGEGTSNKILTLQQAVALPVDLNLSIRKYNISRS